MSARALMRPLLPTRRQARSILHAGLPAFSLSTLMTLWCGWATGANLGLFLGSLLLAATCLPGLVAAEEPALGWAVAVAASVGAAIVWGIFSLHVDVTATELCRCLIVYTAFACALAGLTTLLRAGRFVAPIAAAFVVLTAMAWLTWPVWLSPWLTQRAADWLTPAHPLFAVNAVLRHLGTWDRQPIAYRMLTVLNQDVPYRLPASIAPALLLHLLIGLPGILIACRPARVSGGRGSCGAEAPSRTAARREPRPPG